MTTGDEERQLREAIATLQADYARAAKPYVARLEELNNLRATPPVVTTRAISDPAISRLKRVERAIVLMERYAASKKMVERYGNEYGDRDMLHQCLGELKSLIQDE